MTNEKPPPPSFALVLALLRAYKIKEVAVVLL